MKDLEKKVLPKILLETKKITKYLNAATKELRPEVKNHDLCLYGYGSLASKTINPHSDIDLFFVSPKKIPKTSVITIKQKLKKIIKKRELDIMFFSLAELEEDWKKQMAISSDLYNQYFSVFISGSMHTKLLFQQYLRKYKRIMLLYVLENIILDYRSAVPLSLMTGTKTEQFKWSKGGDFYLYFFKIVSSLLGCKSKNSFKSQIVFLNKKKLLSKGEMNALLKINLVFFGIKSDALKAEEESIAKHQKKLIRIQKQLERHPDVNSLYNSKRYRQSKKALLTTDINWIRSFSRKVANKNWMIIRHISRNPKADSESLLYFEKITRNPKWGNAVRLNLWYHPNRNLKLTLRLIANSNLYTRRVAFGFILSKYYERFKNLQEI